MFSSIFIRYDKYSLLYMFSRFPRFYSPNLLPDSLEFNFIFAYSISEEPNKAQEKKIFLSDFAFELFH